MDTSYTVKNCILVDVPTFTDERGSISVMDKGLSLWRETDIVNRFVFKNSLSLVALNWDRRYPLVSHKAKSA